MHIAHRHLLVSLFKKLIVNNRLFCFDNWLFVSGFFLKRIVLEGFSLKIRSLNPSILIQTWLIQSSSFHIFISICSLKRHIRVDRLVINLNILLPLMIYTVLPRRLFTLLRMMRMHSPCQTLNGPFGFWNVSRIFVMFSLFCFSLLVPLWKGCDQADTVGDIFLKMAPEELVHPESLVPCNIVLNLITCQHFRRKLSRLQIHLFLDYLLLNPNWAEHMRGQHFVQNLTSLLPKSTQHHFMPLLYLHRLLIFIHSDSIAIFILFPNPLSLFLQVLAFGSLHGQHLPFVLFELNILLL